MKSNNMEYSTISADTCPPPGPAVVDPRDRRVIIYGFDDGDSISLYSFQDQIPVGIFGRELCIDFSEINDYLNELLGEDWGRENG